MDSEIINKSPIFSGMSKSEIQETLEGLNAVKRKYKKGSILFHAGNTTDVMGLVLKGSITIENSDPWGNRTILSIVGEGEFFAETYALLQDTVLLVDAVANDNSEILLFHTKPLISETPTLSWQNKLIRNLLSISLQKNLHLSGRSFHTAPKNIRGRIMSYLSSLSLQTGSKEFNIPFDRQQMADYLNVERTALSKELGKMRDANIISFRKNHFRILID